LKFVVIADTHGRHRQVKLPKGDVLIHAGDFTYRGEKAETLDFIKWFRQQQYGCKILIAGNHDFYFEKTPARDLEDLLGDDIIYLNDTGLKFHHLNIWGSPITPKFFNWAFNRSRGNEIMKHWKLIPQDTDLLITHGPPFGILDQIYSESHVGDKDLLQAVKAVRPRVHVFGHIHESFGHTKNADIHFINASQMNENYQLVNRPIVFEL
jgi:Icc-related predicted phosphoesterase